MSSTSSPKAIRVSKYDQERIKGKALSKDGVIPIGWWSTSFVANCCLHEKIGNRWYLMKEEFCVTGKR